MSFSVKPVINEQRSDSTVYSFVGNPNEMRVRCDFYGEPKPSVILTKDGVTLGNGTQFVEHYLQTSKLKDFGDYVCKAKNIHGEGSYTVKMVQASESNVPIDDNSNDSNVI